MKRNRSGAHPCGKYTVETIETGASGGCLRLLSAPCLCLVERFSLNFTENRFPGYSLLFVKTEFIEINFSRSVQSNYLASHMKSEVN